MQAPDQNAITTLLHAARDGDTRAFDVLYGRLYEELRRLAHVVREGRAGETINTTALVHEAYLHLFPSRDLSWQDRSHFFSVAARAMRQVLVQTARRRLAAKRGGGLVTVTLADGAEASSMPLDALMDLNDALDRLGSLDPRQAQIVECRYFAGLSVEETAHALDVGTATVKRDWRAARAWLTDALNT